MSDTRVVHVIVPFDDLFCSLEYCQYIIGHIYTRAILSAVVLNVKMHNSPDIAFETISGITDDLRPLRSQER